MHFTCWSTVAFRSYMHPGASELLRVKQLVPPQPLAGQAYQAWGLLLNPAEDRTPGKTGLLDEAILLDSEPWLHPFLVALTSHRDPESFLWPARGAELVEEFQLACLSLGFSHPKPCRYALRHGGASDDLLTRRRSHLAVKRRGGWATDASLKRYGKETPLLKEIGRIPPAVLAFGSLVCSNHPGVLAPHLPAPACPPARTPPAGTARASRRPRPQTCPAAGVLTDQEIESRLRREFKEALSRASRCKRQIFVELYAGIGSLAKPGVRWVTV